MRLIMYIDEISQDAFRTVGNIRHTQPVVIRRSAKWIPAIWVQSRQEERILVLCSTQRGGVKTFALLDTAVNWLEKLGIEDPAIEPKWPGA